MPTYEYICQDCGNHFERILPLKDYKQPQTCECGSENTGKTFSTCNFVLKGNGWPGKNLRVDSQMTAKNKRLSSRQDEKKREEAGMRLVPNVDGERTDSWRDAQKLAASKGKDTTSYEPLVRRESTT